MAIESNRTRPATVHDELEELRKEYASTMNERLAVVHQVVDQVVQALTRRQKPNWDALESTTHKLAGSSGTYGFKTLSELTRYIEDLITEKQLQSAPAQHVIAHLTRWYDTISRESHAIKATAKDRTNTQAMSDLLEHWASLSTPTSRRAA